LLTHYKWRERRVSAQKKCQTVIILTLKVNN